VADDAQDWVPGRTRDAFTFCVAGSLGEEAIFGHHLTGGFAGDLNYWRRGVSLLDGATPEAMAQVLGCTVEEALESARTWARQRASDIGRLVRALAGVDRSEADFVLIEPAVMTSVAVVDLLRAEA